MDLKEILSSTRAYNFHSHTQFCDGRDSIEDITRVAIKEGIRHLGFSPHSPIPIPSPCNMLHDDFAEYKTEIERVKKMFNDHIHIYMGMEIDFLGDIWGPNEVFFHDGSLDFTIGSIHFIPNRQGILIDIDGRFENFKKRMAEYFDDDIKYVVDTYFKHSHAMLDAGGFDILGHFDKIAQNASNFRPGIESEKWYKTLINDYIDHIIETGCVVEINTKSFNQTGRFFPHERYWKRLVDHGITMIVNSDAHYADRVNASRGQAFKVLDSII